jgi:hypothetical protein
VKHFILYVGVTPSKLAMWYQNLMPPLLDMNKLGEFQKKKLGYGLKPTSKFQQRNGYGFHSFHSLLYCGIEPVA